MSSATAAVHSLEIKRYYGAPPEEVYGAFTQAEALSTWFGPSDDYAVTVSELEVTAGGRFAIEMRHKNGNVSAVEGTYREVVPNEKLVFSWHWASGPTPGETLVTLLFHGVASGTALTLRHELFSSADIRDKHQWGWNGSLARLARQHEEPRTLIPALLGEFEQESKATLRLLERIPGGQLSWRPHPKAFSLGQLAFHIASIPALVSAAVVPDAFELPDFRQPEAASTAQAVETFTAGLEAVRQNLGEMGDVQAVALWSAVRGGHTVMSAPRIQFLRSILLNHSIHHRGQLSVYLRELDVEIPSIYGPSADENPFAPRS